jgi:hypothetical protein
MTVMHFLCRVVSLEMSPMSDQFVSGAVNEGVRLWDLRSPTFLVFEISMMKFSYFGNLIHSFHRDLLILKMEDLALHMIHPGLFLRLDFKIPIVS